MISHDRSDNGPVVTGVLQENRLIPAERKENERTGSEIFGTKSQ